MQVLRKTHPRHLGLIVIQLINYALHRDPNFYSRNRVLLKDEEYHFLQLALLFRPEQGTLIPGNGGLRKLRWGFHGKGKRGGCRIIYYWDRKLDTIYMLFGYPKSKQEDLTRAQIRLLKELVQEEFK